MSIAPSIRDNDGHVPCIPPHVLGAYLDALDKLRPRLTLVRVIAKLAELRRRFLP